MIPQLIYLALVLIGLGIAFEQHGKPKKGNHNTWISCISQTIIIIVLYYGGFFDCFFK